MKCGDLNEKTPIIYLNAWFPVSELIGRFLLLVCGSDVSSHLCSSAMTACCYAGHELILWNHES